MVTDSMFGKIIIFIFVVIFSLFLYLIKESESIHRRIINIVLLMCFTCLSIWGYAHDRQRAYYGDSIFKHNVLPFNLQIIKGWNHELACTVYNLGHFGDVFTETQQITVQNDKHTPNQYLCMQTILSYGYNKEEVVVHWLGCDSCDYYERIDSPEWVYITPRHLITKEDIAVEDYIWFSLVK